MMESTPQGTEILAAIAAFAQCQTPAEVGAALVRALNAFGLNHYAIGGMPTEQDPNPTPFIFHNWPDAWNSLYMQRNYGAVDPVPRAAMTSAMPLTVGDLIAGKAGFLPGPESAEYFAMAEKMTGGRGLIVPISGPYGYHGIVALVGGREDFTLGERAQLHLLGIYAHDRLLTLFGKTTAAAVQLSAREVEVMRLARTGAGDEAVSQQLGISVRTVRFHFENARKKLGVKTRAEAMVKAVGLHLLGA
jgi:DNA-binding CsgD family transcriptional regulator